MTAVTIDDLDRAELRVLVRRHAILLSEVDMLSAKEEVASDRLRAASDDALKQSEAMNAAFDEWQRSRGTRRERASYRKYEQASAAFEKAAARSSLLFKRWDRIWKEVSAKREASHA